MNRRRREVEEDVGRERERESEREEVSEDWKDKATSLRRWLEKPKMVEILRDLLVKLSTAPRCGKLSYLQPIISPRCDPFIIYDMIRYE